MSTSRIEDYTLIGDGEAAELLGEHRVRLDEPVGEAPALRIDADSEGATTRFLTSL